jgi:hypothetical protein
MFGGAEKFQSDQHGRDYLLFYEYFHGDKGAGIGASHQTGWTGLIARLTQVKAFVKSEALLTGRHRRSLRSPPPPELPTDSVASTNSQSNRIQTSGGASVSGIGFVFS